MSDNLSADGLGKRVLEHYDSRIFVWSGIALHEILDFLLELLGALDSGRKHDARLDHLPPDLVGCCGNAALEHIGELEDDVFDLEGTYAVAG